MKSKTIYLILISTLFLLIIFILWFFLGNKINQEEEITIKIKKSDFMVSIITNGELQAKNMENIYGPEFLKETGIWQIKIKDIIPEGSLVKKGDYIAQLDPTEINNKIKDLNAELARTKKLHQKTQLDTAFELRNEREKLNLIKLNVEEDKVNLQQSKYEAPATIRQAEIELEKAQNNYNLTLKNYNFKLEQNINKIQDIENNILSIEEKINLLFAALNSLQIKSPASGIIIYAKENNNEKLKSGSILNLYNNVIATMPNKSGFISKTFINELDINKINDKLEVIVNVDARPEINFKGHVSYISSIPENNPNSFNKSYEVRISLDSVADILKPGMTTKNSFILDSYKNVISIPLEALHQEKNQNFVYKKNRMGFEKTPVETGSSGQNEIIITKGLSENDIIYLTSPDSN